MEHAGTPLRDLVERLFASVEAEDPDALMGLFADDAVLVDPHFPKRRVRGKAAIEEAFRGAMGETRSFGYAVANYCESEDGRCAAVETATHHVLKQGKRLDFPQVFVLEAAGGRLTRVQAYEPYGPHGIVGVFLFFARLKERFSRK